MNKYLLIIFSSITIAVNAQEKKDLLLKDAILEEYSALAPNKLANLRWIPNSDEFSYLTNGSTSMFSQSTSVSKAVEIANITDVNNALLTKLESLSSARWINENNILVTSGINYYRYDVVKKTGKQIVQLPEESMNVDFHTETSKIAYTVGKSLFIFNQLNYQVGDRENEEVVSGQSIARSEFGIVKGTFWSSNANYLAFYEKDETNVSNYPLLDITTTPGNLNTIKYPMAGQESEMARVGVHNLSTKKTYYLKITGEKDQYLTNLSWSPDEKYILLAIVNRGQNHMKLNQYDAQTGDFVQTILEETNEKWVEPEYPAYFISNSDFIWMSEKNGFMNLYHYNLDGKLIKQLTNNKWVVTGIIGYSKSKDLFFTGTGENPTEHHAFKVSINNGNQSKITSESGFHYVQYSDYGLIDQFSSIDVPSVTQILNNEGKSVKILLKSGNPLENYKVGKAEIFTIKAADEQTDLYCRMIKPSNFDPTKKYPVLVYVYGGPHAQLVQNRWLAAAPLWMFYQAERNYIIFTVDNRGSANRGFDFESVIHRKLGKIETLDQMKGVDYLKSLPYVFPNRLAVHGWSFGGFMTTSLMLKYPNAFNVGVAGGPVTDWKYYEVMYGERYMDTPEQNPEGYKNSRLHNYTQNLKGKLLLIHGTIDDVVVMQHNLSLVKSFIDNEIQIDFFPYPMHPHNVRGKDRVHLMTKVLMYVEENNRIMAGKRQIGGPLRSPMDFKMDKERNQQPKQFQKQKLNNPENN